MESNEFGTVSPDDLLADLINKFSYISRLESCKLFHSFRSSINLFHHSLSKVLCYRVSRNAESPHYSVIV